MVWPWAFRNTSHRGVVVVARGNLIVCQWNVEKSHPVRFSESQSVAVAS